MDVPVTPLSDDLCTVFCPWHEYWTGASQKHQSLYHGSLLENVCEMHSWNKYDHGACWVPLQVHAVVTVYKNMTLTSWQEILYDSEKDISIFQYLLHCILRSLKNNFGIILHFILWYSVMHTNRLPYVRTSYHYKPE